MKLGQSSFWGSLFLHLWVFSTAAIFKSPVGRPLACWHLWYTNVLTWTQVLNINVLQIQTVTINTQSSGMNLNNCTPLCASTHFFKQHNLCSLQVMHFHKMKIKLKDNCNMVGWFPPQSRCHTVAFGIANGQ